jgi:uncharacterized repeat protein (TIGR01451 family)
MAARACTGLGHPGGESMRSIVRSAAIAAAFLLACSTTAQAQTATSTASNGLLCARDRAGSNLNCTAGEFTTIVNLTMPPGSPTTCVAGSTLTLNLIVSLSGTNANRYDGAMFVGQAGNDPRNAGGQCSVSRFPIISTGTGFTSFDGDTCGDYIAAGVETWQINNVQVRCEGDPTSGLLSVPYLLSYQQNNPGVCNADSSVLLAPGSPSKCNAGAATVPTLVVRGYVRVTKQTLPDAAADSFAFTAASSLGTPSPTAFNLSDGQSQLVEVNVTGTSRTLTLTEAPTPGWESNASIVCTNPSGGAAPYVTVDNATRTITATLDTANFGAECTITNTRQTRVRSAKILSPGADPGLFNLSAATATATDVGNGGATAFAAIVAGASATFSETAGTGTNLAAYESSYQCVRADNGTVVASGSGASVSFTPPVQQDTTCTFTNRRRNANLRLTKTNTPGVNGEVDQAADTLVSGATADYSIVVTNLGPDAANGSVLTDPAPTGLTCATASCTAAGGAACPVPTGAALVAALQGSGATIPTLPNGGSVTVTLACTVN